MSIPAAADLQYVWGPRYVDDLVLRDKSSERLFAMQDANWNVVAIADATAVVQERYAYSPYGVPVFLTPTFTSRASSSFTWQRLFTGQTYDTQTGLHYFRNRMLHSQVGVFITRDPIGYADGLHLYRAWFVPNAVDPSGKIGLLLGVIFALLILQASFVLIVCQSYYDSLSKEQRENNIGNQYFHCFLSCCATKHLAVLLLAGLFLKEVAEWFGRPEDSWWDTRANWWGFLNGLKFFWGNCADDCQNLTKFDPIDPRCKFGPVK